MTISRDMQIHDMYKDSLCEVIKMFHGRLAWFIAHVSSRKSHLNAVLSEHKEEW